LASSNITEVFGHVPLSVMIGQL